MSLSSTPLPHSVIVTRLRAAGCVFAEDEAELILSTAANPAELAAMVDRRAAGLPLEHVLGWAEFRGLRIAVDPGVFVPRRRTEFLVDQAVGLTRPADGPAVVVDLCCGSGALGAALAAALGRVELHSSDVEPAAVRCARRNVAGAGEVYEGDLFEPLPARCAAASGFCSPMCRTSPAKTSNSCPRRPGSMSRGWRSTVETTGSMCCAEWPPKRLGGWLRADIYWSRRANGRRHGPRRPSPGAD